MIATTNPSAETGEAQVVRVSAGFFDQLDALLGSERGPSGEPSAADFVVIELPAVVERFATDFDGLPDIINGAPAGRVLIADGLLVQAFAVYGILMTDGAIELVGITIDN